MALVPFRTNVQGMGDIREALQRIFQNLQQLNQPPSGVAGDALGRGVLKLTNAGGVYTEFEGSQNEDGVMLYANSNEDLGAEWGGYSSDLTVLAVDPASAVTF